MKRNRWLNFISLTLAFALCTSPVSVAAETAVGQEDHSHAHILTVEAKRLSEVLEQDAEEALEAYSFEKAAPIIQEEAAAAEAIEDPAEEPVEEPIEEPVGEPVGEPAAEPAEEPVGEPAAEPIGDKDAEPEPAGVETQVAGAVAYAEEPVDPAGEPENFDEPEKPLAQAVTMDEILSQSGKTVFTLDKALIPLIDSLDFPFDSALLKEQALRQLEGLLLVSFYGHEALGCEDCQAIVAVDPLTRRVVAVGVNRGAQQHAFVLRILDENDRPAGLANVSATSTEVQEKTLGAGELADALGRENTEIIKVNTAAPKQSGAAQDIEEEKAPQAADDKDTGAAQEAPSEEQPPQTPAEPGEGETQPIGEGEPAKEEEPIAAQEPAENDKAAEDMGAENAAPEMDAQVAGAFVVYAKEEQEGEEDPLVTGGTVLEAASSDGSSVLPQLRAASGIVVLAATPLAVIPTVTGGETIMDTFFAAAVGSSTFTPNVSGNTLSLTQGSNAARFQTGAISSNAKIDLTKSFVLRSTLQLSNAADGIAIVLHNDPRGTAAYGGRGHGLGVYNVYDTDGVENALVIEHDNSRNGEDGMDDNDLDGYASMGEGNFYKVWQRNTVHIALHATGSNSTNQSGSSGDIQQNDCMDRYVFTTQEDVDAIKGAVSSVLYWQAANEPAVAGSDGSYHLVYQLTDGNGNVRQLSASFTEAQVRRYFGLGSGPLSAYVGYTSGTNYDARDPSSGTAKTDCSVTFNQFAYLGFEPAAAIWITQANGAAQADMPAQDSAYLAQAGDVLTVRYTFSNNFNFTGGANSFPSHIKLGGGYANIDPATIAAMTLDGVPVAGSLTAGDGLAVTLDDGSHTLIFEVTVAKTTDDFGTLGKAVIPLVLTADGVPQAFVNTATTGTIVVDPGSELSVHKTAVAKDPADLDDPSDDDYRTYRIDLGADYSGTTLTSKALDIILVIDRSGSMQYRGSGSSYSKDNYTLLGQFSDVAATLDTTKEYYYFRTQANSRDSLTATSITNANFNGRMSYNVFLSRWQYGNGSNTNSVVGPGDYIWARNDRLCLVKDAVDSFLEQVPEGSRVGIVSYANNSSVNASAGGKQLLDITTRKALLRAGVNGLTPLGGTQTNSALGTAYGILNDPSKWEEVSSGAETRQKVVVLLTDGIYQGTDPMQEGDVPGYARQIKGAGMELYVAGIDVSDSTADTMKAWASGAGAAEKGRYFTNVSTNGAAGLNNMFQNLTTILFGSMNAVVKDYVDPRFNLVDKNGAALAAGDWIAGDGTKTTFGAQNAKGEVKYDAGRNEYYVEWAANIGHNAPEGSDESWSATLYVKAKENYVGNNNVPTNGSASGVYYVYDTDQNGFRSFGSPRVDVPLKYELSAKDAYLYLGDAFQAAAPAALASDISGWIADEGTGFDYQVTAPAQGTQPTADTGYTLRVTVTPASGTGSATDLAPTVQSKQYTDSAVIHVLKPTIPLTDTTVFLGESAQLAERVGAAEWTVKAPEWVAVGSALPPVLVYEFYTPRESGVVAAPATAPMMQETHYDVKTYRQDAQDNAAFDGFVTYTWSCDNTGAEHLHATPITGNGWFTIHVISGTLTITKTTEKNYPVVFDAVEAGQSFIFEVKKDGALISREVITPAYNRATGRFEGSVTLTGLTAGTYTVTEDTAWAWRYDPVGEPAQVKTISSATASATAGFENRLKNQSWVGDATSQSNVFYR
ncbi:MAG: VWA domain-containing protein [Oscillospiraceae bacterium]|nr:VWA domain-containing protein [Oscillospiraceae bacterium]